jgi:hypothetical protein
MKNEKSKTSEEKKKEKELDKLFKKKLEEFKKRDPFTYKNY